MYSFIKKSAILAVALFVGVAIVVGGTAWAQPVAKLSTAPGFGKVFVHPVTGKMIASLPIGDPRMEALYELALAIGDSTSVDTNSIFFSDKGDGIGNHGLGLYLKIPSVNTDEGRRALAYFGLMLAKDAGYAVLAEMARDPQVKATLNRISLLEGKVANNTTDIAANSSAILGVNSHSAIAKGPLPYIIHGSKVFILYTKDASKGEWSSYIEASATDRGYAVWKVVDPHSPSGESTHYFHLKHPAYQVQDKTPIVDQSIVIYGDVGGVPVAIERIPNATIHWAMPSFWVGSNNFGRCLTGDYCK